MKLSANRTDTFTPIGSNLYKLQSSFEDSRVDRNLMLFTADNNLAAERVTARKVDGDLTPSNTSTQISNWIKECALHGCCPPQINVPLPTRVIDVATPRILPTEGACGKFTALSYCWGSGSQIQLRSNTLQALTQHLDFDELPQTMQDAIAVTRLLSIPYLWVC